MYKEYIGILKVNGKKHIEISSADKEGIAEVLCDCLSHCIDEGENFSVTIKCKEIKK